MLDRGQYCRGSGQAGLAILGDSHPTHLRPGGWLQETGGKSREQGAGSREQGAGSKMAMCVTLGVLEAERRSLDELADSWDSWLDLVLPEQPTTAGESTIITIP